MSRLREMLSDELLRKALREGLAHGGEFAEVYAQDSVQTSLSLKEGTIRSAESRSTLGAGVRVIVGEQTGYAYTDILTEESLLEAARTAGRIAVNGNSSEPAVLKIISHPTRYQPINSALGETSLKAKLLMRADATARKADPRVIEVQGSYTDDFKNILIANSEGLLVEDEQPMVRMTVAAVAREGEKVHDGTYGAGGRTGLTLFERETPEMLAEEAARQAIVQLTAKDAPAGLMPVVIANGWGGVLLHEAIGHGLEADFNRKGSSLYSGRIGEMVANKLCTVLDDATIEGQRGSLNIDDEGTLGQKTVLIDQGRLVAYMNDRLNGKLMEMPLTGNGRRQSYQSVPVPRMTSTYLAAGDSDPEEIMRSVKKGLYAKFLGGGQVDITNGNFVFAVTEGYMIEDGKIGTPVRGATLIGNGPDILTKVSMVGTDMALDRGLGSCGKEGQWAPCNVGMPTVLVSEITVGGTAIG
ncbi:MAG: metallopeptidase TldD-related protein [bacterium]